MNLRICDMDERELKRAIKAANHNLEDRLESSTIDMQYDYSADILYVTFGEPQEAVSYQEDNTDDNVYLRISPDTSEVLGIDFHYFREAYLPAHAEWQNAWQIIHDLFGEEDFWIRLQLHAGNGHEAIGVGALRKFIPKTVRELLPT